MTKDIDDMEKMLNDYLQFAKTQAIEETSQVNIENLFNEIRQSINSKNLTYHSMNIVILKEDDHFLKGVLKILFRMGICGKSSCKIYKGSKILAIIFEDDGPGIPEDQYKNVFKPFSEWMKVEILINLVLG